MMGALGHYQPSSILNIKDFIKPSAASKANIGHVLDSAAIELLFSKDFYGLETAVSGQMIA